MDDFDRLCREQEGLVYRYLLSLCRDGALAEELTAETFYRAYLHIGSFRGECRVETWLCGIARSAFFREQKRRKRLCPQEDAAALPARDDLLERFHDREQALAAITIGAARIAGIADQVGSLTPGKDADIVITHGDPLDMLCQVRKVWIDGRLVKG